MSKVSEFAAIDVLQRGLSRGPASDAVRVGIGDDAAVLRPPSGELVCSIDSSLEGVHFDLRWLSVELAARRAIHAAVSDLAAMGAAPLAAVVALEVPGETTRTTFAAIARGQARAARETACPVVGGNITGGGRLAFTTTVLGTCGRGRSVLRSGAQPGDEIWLSGEVGWAGLGLSMLQARRVTFDGKSHRARSAIWGKVAVDAARRWCTPSARVSVGQTWQSSSTSMIDVSDSLASEAGHLAAASGVRLTVDAKALLSRRRKFTHACQVLGADPLHLSLYGGEDYALLATGPRRARPADARVIGYVQGGEGAWVLREGRAIRLERGFDHLQPPK